MRREKTVSYFLLSGFNTPWPRAWVSSAFLQVTLDPLQWRSNRLLAKKNKRTARRLVQNSMSDDLGVIPGAMSYEDITACSSFVKCRRIVSMHLKNKTVTTRSTGRKKQEDISH